MANYRPLIINTSAQQIQELPTSDGLIFNGAFPIGGIIMWSGAISAIPTGWSLCDGSSGTPDLRNRFVVGAHSDGANSTWPNLAPDDTGGNADATLVSHSHTVDAHNHVFPGDDGLQLADGVGGLTNRNVANFNYDADSNTNAGGKVYRTSDTSPGTNTQGSSATAANLPPYLALAYIMRVS